MSVDVNDYKDFCTGVSEKLDELLRSQIAAGVKMDSLSDTVGEIKRTVLGFNGTPGITTKLALLEESFRLHNDEYGSEQKTQPLKGKPADPDHERKFISWAFISERLLAPVLVSIIIWLSLEFLPKLFVHVGTP